MANLLYREHLIIASADVDDMDGLWNLSVDISWSMGDSRQFQMLHLSRLCSSKDEIENFGLETGKAWVDEHRCP